jgi:hypothetical protein
MSNFDRNYATTTRLGGGQAVAIDAGRLRRFGHRRVLGTRAVA